MELFSKKYDRVKDSLVIEFDLEKKCFYFSKSGEIISYEKLNKKTKLFLDLMNEQLKDPTYLSSVIAQKETENAINHTTNHVNRNFLIFYYITNKNWFRK